MTSLRILFLAGRDPAHSRAGGGDIQAWAWARWAAEQGHTIIFVAQGDRSLPQQEVVGGIQVLRLGSGIRLALRAWRYYRSHYHEIDLIYEDPIGSGRVPYLSPVYARVPVVAVWHQVSARLFNELYAWPLARAGSLVERWLARLYHRCYLWIPSQERADEVIRELGFDRSRVKVIPPTIPSDVLDADARTRDEAVVLFLGVIRRYKAIDHGILAMAQVIRAVPDAKLVLAGRALDGTYAEELMDLVARLDLTSHVVMNCDINEDEKYRLLRAARVLILPSVLEGFGIVTLEANAVGTPAVVSTGIPKAAVEHGVNGFRYEYGDIDQLASAVTQLLDDDILFERMAAASFNHAARFTPGEIGVKFKQLMDVALGSDDE